MPARQVTANTWMTQRSPVPSITTVYTEPYFSVSLTSEQTYGQGQRHDDWLGSVVDVVDLKLDIYQPVFSTPGRRPVIVFIHGGFREGDKTNGAAKYFGEYFASRGLVVVSVNYRLMTDYGTIPAAWKAYVDTLALTDYKRQQHYAMYPAVRDVKAALRWITVNADSLNVDPKRTAIIGSSAGAIIGIALGTTDLEDFSNELTVNAGPTVSTINLSITLPKVRAVVDFWGTGDAVDVLNETYKYSRWDRDDAPLLIVHGTDDTTISYDEAIYLTQQFQTTGVSYQLCTLQGMGHGAWDGVCDGKTLDTVAFDFLVHHLGLTLVTP